MIYDELTKTEWEVVRRIPGNTNRAIAREMGISSNTVKQHIAAAAQKLRCVGTIGEKIRCPLFFRALRCGCVTMSEILEAPMPKRIGRY